MKYIVTCLLSIIALYPIKSQHIGEIQMTDCYLDDCSWIEKFSEVEFGFITVPEDYQKPDGRLIKVAFSIIKARVENPKGDAIIYFQGGWGVPSVYGTKGFMRTYPLVDRDIILFDYRGTGFSEPALCTSYGTETYQDIIDNLSYEEFKELQIKRLSQCLDTLEIQQIDFLQYGSANEMRDVRMLMDELDYDSYNLFGISYGTRRILDLLRLSDQKVRSVILDSNCPIGSEEAFMGNVSLYYYNVITQIMSDCANDEQCNLRFPDLKEKFEAFLGELEEKPLHLKSEDSDIYLNAAEINAILHQLLYSRYYYGDFPILLESLINREISPISNILVGMKSRVISQSNGVGLVNFVIDWNIYKQEIQTQYDDFVNSEKKNYEIIDLYLPYFLQDDRFTVDSLNAVPLISEVPALIISGSYDPITPPHLSEFVHLNFKNSFYYIFPKEGHGPIKTSAGEDLMRQFFDQPGTEPNDSILQALGSNEITFTTAYYKNYQMMTLIRGLTQKLNLWLIVALGLIVIVSLVNVIKAAIAVIIKKTFRNVMTTLVSLLIFLFIFGLGYFIYLTTMHKGPLMLFGLVSESKFLFFLVPLIFILTATATVKTLKQKKISWWNYISIGSYTLFIMVVFWFQLFPNF